MGVFEMFKFLTLVMILQNSMIAEAAEDSHEGYNNTFNACNEILNDADLSIDTGIMTTTGKAVLYDKYSIDRDMMTGVVDDGDEEDKVLAELPYVDVTESNDFLLHSDIYSVKGELGRSNNAKPNGVSARDTINTYFSTHPKVVIASIGAAVGVAGAITNSNVVISYISTAFAVASLIYVYVQKEFRECHFITTTFGGTNYLLTACTTNKNCDHLASSKAINNALLWALQDAFYNEETSGTFRVNHGRSWHVCVLFYVGNTTMKSFPENPERECGCR